MTGLFAGVKASVRSLARAAAFSAVFGLVGVFLALAGFLSLTAALWIVIATYQGTVVAFAFIGILYLAFGAVFLALAAHPPRDRGRRGRPVDREPDSPAPPREPLVQIAEGFAIGMQAGRAARRPRD